MAMMATLSVMLPSKANAATDLYRSVGITPTPLARGGASSTEAIKIQRGTANVPNTGTTQTAPTNFTAFGSLTSTFVLNKNNRFGSAGRSTPYSTTVYVDDLSLRIALTATNTITFTRLATGDAADYRADWESWEYVGPAGGPNEFIVRSKNTITITGGSRTNTATLSSTPANINKCIPFITGISNTGAGTTSPGLTALAWVSGTNTLNVERGGSTGDTVVQVVTVEFTGSNWKVGHGRTADFDGVTGDTGTVTLYANADGQTTAFTLNNVNNAIIASAQFKGDDTDGNNAIADTYPAMHISSTTQVSWVFYTDHDGVDNQIFVHILENAGMSVTRYTNTGSLAGDNNVDITSAGITDLTNTAIFATRETSGTGTTYPRGWTNYRITSTTNAALWCTRSGNTIESRIEIAIMPEDAAVANGLSISGSTATFSTALANNIGVGDVIQYDSDGNDTIDAIAFIHGRASSTIYTVKDKNGNAPTAVTSDYNWAIYRAYTSLANWQSQTENPNITEPVENDVNPSMDLVSANTILNVACYGDGADITAVTISGWTTGANNYIKIYTPVSSSEVGVSQRHNGKWDDSKYRIESTSAPINIGAAGAGVGNAWIDGLQIYLSSVIGNGNSGILVYQTTSANHRISNNIVRSVTNNTYNYVGIYMYAAAAGSTARIWNNIVYDFAGTTGWGIAFSDSDFTGYVYNNTVYNCAQGYHRDAGTVIAKNSISYSNTDNYNGIFDGSSTNNLSGPGSDLQIPPTGARNGVTVTFVDPNGSPRDLHLASSDTGAKDYAANLSSDPNLAFSDDIDGQGRPYPYGSAWDIGADEYVDGSFGYRRKITLNCSGRGSSCTGGLSDFPVLIDTTNWPLADKNLLRTVANGGQVYNSNGWDIIFRASNGVTHLDHEIGKYDGSSGTLVAWVRIPTLFDQCPTTGTDIYMYYGNAGISSNTENPTGVWGNYAGVWHLSESSGSGYYLKNSKQDNYHADAGSTLYLSNSKIDGGRDLNGDYCDVQNGGDLLDSDTAFTLEFWAYPDYTSDAAWTSHSEDAFLMSDSLSLCRWFKGSAPANTGEIQCDVKWSDSSTNWFNNNDSLVRAQWNHVVLTYDGSDLRWYINGSQVEQSNDPGHTLRTNSYLSFGDSTVARPMNSNFDEFRYSRVARNACWIQTEYNNQSNPLTFITLDPTEESPAPTAVKLTSFTANQYPEGVLLRWKTGHEVNNLGFHVYREENGQLVRLTPEPVAGSALMAGSRTALTAGHHYHWWDVSSLSAISHQPSAIKYWLKDIDLSGKHTMHGPVAPVFSKESVPNKFRPDLLSEVGWRLQGRYRDFWRVQDLKEKIRSRSLRGAKGSLHLRSLRTGNKVPLRSGPTGLEGRGFHRQPSPSEIVIQQFLAGRSAVKLFVKEEGWYRVTQPKLVAAGLSPRVNPDYLQLYVDGREQPIRVIGGKDGRFGPRDAIEFYGAGLDTPSTDTRVYWLIEGHKAGKRIREYKSHGGQISSLSFPHTVENNERTVYFAALRNGEEENFFGPVVYMNEVDQILELEHLDRSATEDALLEVVLQGATEGHHRVKVLLNEAEVGEIAFEGQGKGTLRVEVPQSMLEEGENLVSLVAMSNEMDATLLDSIRLTYWHTYTADDNGLRLTAQGGGQLSLSGFSNSRIRVFDITEPDDPIEVLGKVESQKGGYAVSFRVPGTEQRTLLALTEEKVETPEGITPNHPSAWHQGREGYDLVIISHRDFVESLQSLKKLRDSQGLRVALIDVEDIYDEFSFGNKSPKALKEFLGLAKKRWHRPPRFVLLVGDASFDPKNYLGLGDMDYVPTKLIDTTYMETASDDWFVDLNNDGLPEMAVGRLPVQTAEEAAVVVSKIVGYEKSGKKNEALLVADRVDNSDDFNFEGASEEVRALLPAYLTVRKIFRGQFSNDAQAKGELLNGINQGALLVNFIGHGSVESWRGSLLTLEDAESLINGLRLPFFVNMTCLNGFFQNPYGETLAEALMKASGGGAIAIWTSSGLTEPDKQAVMNKELIKLLFGREAITLGEATAKAKASVSDQDIRRTWILFGDPTTRLK
jgi:hypothetical protein